MWHGMVQSYAIKLICGSLRLKIHLADDGAIWYDGGRYYMMFSFKAVPILMQVYHQQQAASNLINVVANE